jgi:hypothetical protein
MPRHLFSDAHEWTKKFELTSHKLNSYETTFLLDAPLRELQRRMHACNNNNNIRMGINSFFCLELFPSGILIIFNDCS